MGRILLVLLGPAVAVNLMIYLSEKYTDLYLSSLSLFFCEKVRFNFWFCVQRKAGNSLKGSTTKDTLVLQSC